MSTDINNLNLQEPNTDFWDSYEDPKAGTGGTVLLPKGEYIMQIVPGSTEFQADKNGNLVAVTTLKVMEGPHAEKEVRFQRFSVRKYGFRNGSEAGDLVRAAQPQARPRLNEEWRATLLACEGVPVKIYGDWEAYDKTTKQTLKGMENFPIDADGNRIGLIVKEDPQGVEYNVWGNWRWRKVLPVA